MHIYHKKRPITLLISLYQNNIQNKTPINVAKLNPNNALLTALPALPKKSNAIGLNSNTRKATHTYISGLSS